MTSPRLPSIYISHGGGPCFWMDFPPPYGAHAFDGLRSYLNGLLDTLPIRPKAFLVISGHWEETVPTIGVGEAPGMLFDYYGFPAHTYLLTYPALGDPALAARVGELLNAAGIANATDAERGYDHGVFVPFLMIDPKARIPVVTLSLRHDLDPAAHLAIGAALAPLRDEGVLIVGSGNSYHNLSSFIDGEPRAAAMFDEWLADAVTHVDAAERQALLIDWEAAPAARASHPREDHLIPLMVAAGAGGADPARRVFSDTIGQKAISGFAFG